MDRPLCECGCGYPTTVHRDKPRRFLHGHNGRKSGDWFRVDESGCWTWQLARSGEGYGRIGTTPAHRVFYEAFVGAIPDGLHLDHLCRNPSCVRPSHLDPVTNAENCQRGRLAKLCPEQVREIRASDLSAPRLAEQYGVTLQNIQRIRRRETWRNV